MMKLDVDKILKEVKSNPQRYPVLSAYNRGQMANFLLTSDNVTPGMRDLTLALNNIGYEFIE